MNLIVKGVQHIPLKDPIFSHVTLLFILIFFMLCASSQVCLFL